MQTITHKTTKTTKKNYRFSKKPKGFDRTGKPPFNNGTTGSITTKIPRLSDLTFLPLFKSNHFENLTDKQLKTVVSLLVNYTKRHDKEVDVWEFDINIHTLQDVINRCLYSLYNILDVDDVSIFKNGKELTVDLFAPITTQETVYILPLLKVFCIKHKSPKLFEILMSFILQLPFVNMFQLEGISHAIMEWMASNLDESISYKENVNYKETYDSLFIPNRVTNQIIGYDISNWRERLMTYKPRIKLYQKLKQLLLKSDTINFNCIHNTYTHFDDEYEFDLNNLYVIGDNTESCFSRYYVDYVNDIANNYGTLTSSKFAIIQKNKVVDFNKTLDRDITQTNNFLIELTDLLNEL